MNFSMTPNLAAILYVISGVLFILALRGLSSPATSRRGNVFGMLGIAIAIITTLLAIGVTGFGLILVVVALAIGGGIGALIAKKIPMTDMPQLIAGFHSAVAHSTQSRQGCGYFFTRLHHQAEHDHARSPAPPTAMHQHAPTAV